MTKIEQVQLINIDDIDSSQRLRPVDTSWVNAIAASISKSGLNSPIDICQIPNQKSGKNFKLVSGGHRLEAYRLLGLQEIPAFVRSNETLDCLSREISENIFRADLKPYERATFIAELYELERHKCGLEKGEDGRKVSAVVRWQNAKSTEIKSGVKDATATIAVAFGFTEKVAETIGFSPRTVRDDITLMRISPALIEKLREVNSPVVENASQLKALAKLEQEKIAPAVVSKICDGMTFNEAIAPHLNKPVKTQTPTQKREVAFISLWKSMSENERIAALKFLVGKEPRGFKITEGA